MLKNILLSLALTVVILIIGFGLMSIGNKVDLPNSDDVVTVVAQVSYQCEENHTIKATYIEKGPVPVVVSGEMPTSNASVVLSLDGASDITLPQAISADGARFANDDESLVFWSKGSGTMVLENNEQKTYKNCIEVKENTSNLSQVYLDVVNRLTLRYPADYTFDDSYQYESLGPNTSISGVKFTIPESVATGTNLSNGSYLSIEHRNDSEICSASDFLSMMNGTVPQIIEDGDFTYSVASSSEAGAGNRYEEYVYALPGTNPCLAIRYFIHYSAIENYDPGTIVEFDKESLLTQFDEIRHSVTLDIQIVPSPLLNMDVYPLYSGLVWGSELTDTFAGMDGYSVQSDSLTDIVDIAAVTQPFEKYYADLLIEEGWTEDISMAAGGPGSAIIAYKKGSEYIILQYTSAFGVNNENEPAQCPCEVTFKIFSVS